MKANGPAPFEFKNDGSNCAIEWRNWLRGYEIYARVNKIKIDQDKLDWMLHFAGPKVQNVFFNLPEENTADDGQYMEGFPLLVLSEYDKALNKLEALEISRTK